MEEIIFKMERSAVPRKKEEGGYSNLRIYFETSKKEEKVSVKPL